MIHVRREKPQIGGLRPLLRAHGNMQLIGGHDTELGIAELPPELVADDRNIQCGLRLGRILNGEDNARRGEEQDYDDEHWNHCPGQFNLGAAVDLRWLVLHIALSRMEFDDNESKQTSNDDKDRAGNQPVRTMKGGRSHWPEWRRAPEWKAWLARPPRGTACLGGRAQPGATPGGELGEDCDFAAYFSSFRRPMGYVPHYARTAARSLLDDGIGRRFGIEREDDAGLIHRCRNIECSTPRSNTAQGARRVDLPETR